MKTVVLGLGNALQSAWQGDDTVEFVDGGTLSFTLTSLLYDADNLIVIDAAQLSSQPGVVKVFTNDEMDTFVRTSKCSSAHVSGVDHFLVVLIISATAGVVLYLYKK